MAASDDPAGLSTLKLVRKAYAEAGGITANFVQTEERPGVGKKTVEEGTLSFLLPDKMLWQYGGRAPHTFGVDGTQVWIHTPSRKQVVKKTVTREEMRSGGATFLSGLEGVEKDFFVTGGARDAKGLLPLTLTPRKPELAPYTAIETRVDPATGLLAEIKILHKLGNTTTIAFSGAKTRVKLSPDLFKLVIPPGTEVVEP